ncbi:hypothetical protein [Flavobacterium sp.]|uniref:hypothetical protein n=1 Tax=Flavobacterium sp. TaxID=239 RepID=UPI003753A440
MKYEKIKDTIDTYHSEGKTIEAAEWLLKMFDVQDTNLKNFALREKAKPDYILFTAEGDFGEEQVIRMPENAFEFPLPLILSLLTHEMVHVRQKSRKPYVLDKLEREWQAYYEMLFHKIFPNYLEVSNFHKKFFADKAYSYYKRMGEGSELQAKYANQKKEIEDLIASLG